MADSVSSTDAKLLKKLGGVGLVMTIIFTISVSENITVVLTCNFNHIFVKTTTYSKGKNPRVKTYKGSYSLVIVTRSFFFSILFLHMV